MFASDSVSLPRLDNPTGVCPTHRRQWAAVSYTHLVGFQMEEKIEQAYLYDFYGELLNEHQRRIYEDFVFNDLSLGEIADEEGISRQGVHDMVKRCTKTLEGYEAVSYTHLDVYKRQRYIL